MRDQSLSKGDEGNVKEEEEDKDRSFISVAYMFPLYT